MNLRGEESLRRACRHSSADAVLPLSVGDEKIHENLPLPRYVLHNMIMGCELYLINRVN